MGSKKRSNWSKQKASFNDSLSASLGPRARSQGGQEAFAVEEQRRLASRKRKACTSKKRYGSALLAKAAIDACQEYGRGSLSSYHCDFCGGWHLTSHPFDN